MDQTVLNTRIDTAKRTGTRSRDAPDIVLARLFRPLSGEGLVD